MPEPVDRTPTGDLRDQITEALGDPEGADAVMHVIESHILAITVDATQRADTLAARLQEAERERDEERVIRQQAEEIIAIAHQTSNTSERARQAAEKRAKRADDRAEAAGYEATSARLDRR